MKKFLKQKYLFIASTALLFFFGLTQFAFAEVGIATDGTSPAGGVANSVGTAGSVANSATGIFTNISYYFIGKVAFGVAYIIAWIAGIAISIEAWLVGTMLGINTGVFQSQIVQKGFGVTLSIANLGFVLGIIIIALATILHRETYGWKKLLWKLVVAAILVNFSLVIAAPIFGLGNSFTQYFLNCVDPGGGGCSGQGAGVGLTGKNSMNDFASSLAGAFNPQNGLISNPNGTLSGNLSGNQSAAALGQSLGSLLTPLISIIFVAFELIATVIVLAVFIFMLLVRYVYIAILAILMPFAWLGWVFPNIKDWWSKWWNQFFRWTFFAPIVIFFLYLAMQTQQSMANGTAVASQTFGTYTSSSNPIWGPISTFFTSVFTPIIAQLLNSFVLIGLTIGGLIVADRLSIMGAKAGIGAAQSVGKGVQGWAGKQTKKAGRALYQKTDKAAGKVTKRFGGSDIGLTQRLQEGKIGALKYIPFARRGASYAGQGLSSLKKAGGQDLVEEQAKWAKDIAKNPQEAKSVLAGSLNTEKQIALLKAMAENKDLDIVKKVNGKALGDYIAENKKLIADSYGNYKFYDKDLRKVNIDPQATPEAKAVAAGKGDEDVLNEDGKTVKAIDGLRDSLKRFTASLSLADVPKIDTNGMFSQSYLDEKDEDGNKSNEVRIKMFLQQMAAYNYQIAPAIMKTLKGKQQSTFAKMYTEAMNQEERDQASNTNKSDQETALKNIKLAKENFDRVLVNLARGSGEASGGDEKKAESAPAPAPDEGAGH